MSRATKPASKKIIKVPKREGKKRKSLIEEADTWASRYIRLRDMRPDGLVQCYTCTAILHPKAIQCGHFVGRAHYSTRYDMRNMHAQCQRCNKFRSGEPGAYAYRLYMEIGNHEFVELLKEGLREKVLAENELHELINKFKELTNQALRDKNIRPWW